MRVHGKVVPPKTEASVDVVSLGEDFVAYIEQFRRSRRGINAGYMFGYSKDRPIDLDSFHWWTLRPILDAVRSANVRRLIMERSPTYTPNA